MTTDTKLDELRTAKTIELYDIRLKAKRKAPRHEITKSTWLSSRKVRIYFLNWITPDGRRLAIPTTKAIWDLF